MPRRAVQQCLEGCLDRLGGQEEAPALLALADAHELVLPPAHDRIVVLCGKVAHKFVAAGLRYFQLLPQARLKLHGSTCAVRRPQVIFV